MTFVILVLVGEIRFPSLECTVRELRFPSLEEVHPILFVCSPQPPLVKLLAFRRGAH